MVPQMAYRLRLVALVRTLPAHAAVVLLGACATELTEPVQSTAAVMVGRWEYAIERPTTSEPRWCGQPSPRGGGS